jgi:hypothetical protein
MDETATAMRATTAATAATEVLGGPTRDERTGRHATVAGTATPTPPPYATDSAQHSTYTSGSADTDETAATRATPAATATAATEVLGGPVRDEKTGLHGDLFDFSKSVHYDVTIPDVVARTRVRDGQTVRETFKAAEYAKRKHYRDSGATAEVTTLIASEFGAFNGGLNSLIASLAKECSTSAQEATRVREFWTRNIVFDMARTAASLASASERAMHGDRDKTAQSISFASWLQSSRSRQPSEFHEMLGRGWGPSPVDC